MRRVLRWGVALVALLLAAMHLIMGAAGRGWVHLDQVTTPTGDVTWWPSLAAGLLLALAGIALGAGLQWWWVACTVAAVTSQAVVTKVWTDPTAATAASTVVLLAGGYGLAREGPGSSRLRLLRHVERGAATSTVDPLTEAVTESDLMTLPTPLADYLRRTGSVGRSRVPWVHARLHGRLRTDPGRAWLAFSEEQVHLVHPEVSRVAHVDACVAGLAVDTLEVLDHGVGALRMRLFSMLPLGGTTGPEVTRYESVRMLIDLCLFAPAALLDAEVTWDLVEPRCVRGRFTCSGDTVTAYLWFDHDHDLIHVASDDALRPSSDGQVFTPQRWSARVTAYGTFGSRRVVSRAEGYWHDPAGTFRTLEVDLDEVDLAGAGSVRRRSRTGHRALPRTGPGSVSPTSPRAARPGHP